MTPVLLAAPIGIFRSHYVGYMDYTGRLTMEYTESTERSRNPSE